DVAREVGAGVHRREQRALDERDRQQERHDRAAREAGQVRLGPEPARVDREQEQREEQRRDHVGRLAQCPHDRAPAEQIDLIEGVAHAGSVEPTPALIPAPSSLRRRSYRLRRAYAGRHQAADSIASPPTVCCSSSSPSPEPSSERPVFARKTSSSEGWCSWSWSIAMPWVSKARTIPARSACPVARRTATPMLESHGAPKLARIAFARSASAGSTGLTSTVGRPISAFKASGGPSATIRP